MKRPSILNRCSIFSNIRLKLRKSLLFTAVAVIVCSSIAASISPALNVAADPNPSGSCAESGGTYSVDSNGNGVCTGTTATCPNSPVEAKGGNYIPATGGCSPDDEAKSYSYYVVLSGCVYVNMKSNIVSDVIDGDTPPITAFFGDGSAYTNNSGFIFPGAVKTTCAAALTAALKLWGFTSSDQTDPAGTKALLVAMGDYSYKSGKSNSSNPEYDQTDVGINQAGDNREKAFQNAVKNQVYGGSTPTLSNAAIYDVALDAFTRKGSFDSNYLTDDSIAQCNAHDYGDITKSTTSQNVINAAKPPGQTVQNDKTGDYNFFANVSAARTYIDIIMVDKTGTPSTHAYAYLSAKSYGANTYSLLANIETLGATLPLTSLLNSQGQDDFTHAETFAYLYTTPSSQVCSVSKDHQYLRSGLQNLAGG